MLALVTGATSGIGKSTAALLAKNGYDLIITGRRKERLDALSSEWSAGFGVKVLALQFDVRNADAVAKAIGSLEGPWKEIDVLVNNAGLAAGLSAIQDGDLQHWERMIDTNVKGLLYVSRLVSRLMIARKKGHIVNIGSIAGQEVYANGNVYCATKHAVDALNKAMRIDLLPHHILVTAVNPGMVETEFSVVRFDGDTERAAKVYAGLQPLSPDDVADTVLWCVTRPPHVNINEVLIMPAAQATATIVNRR